MPKLYEYLGIIISFWSGEHEPIHVHGKHGGRECKALIYVQNGKVLRVAFRPIAGGLEKSKQKAFEAFVDDRAEEIVDKWTDYFVRHKAISPERITVKI